MISQMKLMIKKTKVFKQDLEFYGYHRSLRSIRRADVVLLFIDASSPISRVDKALIRGVLVYDRIRDGQRY